MKCFACNREINKKGLGYDINTLKTYCITKCERPELIPGELIEMKDSSLKTEIIENYPEEIAESLNRMIGKVSSVRLVPYMAMHLMKTAQENNLHSVNETLLFIIERDFQQYEIKEELETPEEVKEPREPKVIEPPNKYELYVEGQPPVVYETEIPAIKEVEPGPTPVEPEPVEEPKEEVVEDEFTF